MIKIYKKILVGIDGSDDAIRAAEKALEFQKRDNSEVVAFCSILHKLTYFNPPIVTPGTENVISFHLPPERITIAKNALNKVKRIFDDFNASIETRVISDKEPDHYIRDMAEKEGFDLVILGCRGEHSKISRVIGTITEKVINDAPCDVLIIR